MQRIYKHVLNNNLGFTMLELLVGGLISIIVAAAVMEFYITQHNQWLVQEQISDMQQNGRASVDELSTKLRMAGYGMPKGAQCLYASNTNPDTITLVYIKEPGCNPPLEHAMPQPSSELRCDGHDISCFKDDQWAYIFDNSTQTGEFFWVTQVQYGSSHIQHNLPPDLSMAYPKGSVVMSVDVYKYYIDTTTDSNHPRLMRTTNFGTPEVFAEDIEALEFVYTLVDGTSTSTPSATADIRSVQFTITAKTGRKDEDFASNSGFRKRTFQSRIWLRNPSFS